MSCRSLTCTIAASLSLHGVPAKTCIPPTWVRLDLRVVITTNVVKRATIRDLDAVFEVFGIDRSSMNGWRNQASYCSPLVFKSPVSQSQNSILKVIFTSQSERIDIEAML